ncbi:MAG: hypothetical protein M3416_04750, partial [Acidobacteriota bacterium]|nr:hypothetical protein [Acidobacteriota bacterium]
SQPRLPPGHSRDTRRVPQPPSIREREIIMREMEKEANSAPRPKPAELALAEIAEDYKRLQLVNNEMMAAVIRAPAPDYKLVAEATAEIRERAERLRGNLKLPEPDADAEARPEPRPAADAAGLKAALLALDRSIMSFVGSPLFKNTDVIDAGAAAKASRDLADVIERSRLAGKDAARLGKKSAGP